MKSEFLTDLSIRLKPGCDGVWVVTAPLKYQSELLNCVVVVPYWFESAEPDPADADSCFEMDMASVPRLPIIYSAWGDRVHREAVLHDYLYRVNSRPQVSREQADEVFLEAMKSRGVSWWIRWPMYLGVRAGGWGSYHKKFVNAQLF